MTPTVSMNNLRSTDAQVGDWLQYKFTFRKWGMQDWSITTRRVAAVVTDGVGAVIGYRVDRDFYVPIKDVLSIVSMREPDSVDAEAARAL